MREAQYWSGLQFPPVGDLPDSGIEPASPALQADCLPIEPLGKPPSLEQEVYKILYLHKKGILSAFNYVNKLLYSFANKK